MRLLAAGLRPVSNVVDATNYVMLELGKPTHAFDAAVIARDANGRAGLTVRLAVAGERLETLDHVERELETDALLIADGDGPLALAGVMGGARSEVSGATRDVIIESAVFDPVSIRRTAFRHALRSEASLRFEKGQEARLARLGADRVAELVVAWAGGDAARGRVDTAPDEPGAGRVPFRPARINRLLGTAFTDAEQIELLGRIGIDVDAPSAAAGAGAPPVALVPTWRRDIHIEADIAEEIARVGGYDAVPTKTPDTPMPRFRPDPLERRDAIRRLLAGAGLTEVVTPALVPEWQAERLAWPVAAAAGITGEEAVAGDSIRVRNPLSERHAVLRRGLVGSLLDVLASNERHGRDDVAIFEVGKGYAAGADGSPAEWWRLAFLLAGAAVPASWNLGGRPWEIEDGKALVALVARTLGAAPPVFLPHLEAGAAPPGAIRARNRGGQRQRPGRRDSSRHPCGMGPARGQGRRRGARDRRAGGGPAPRGPRRPGGTPRRRGTGPRRRRGRGGGSGRRGDDAAGRGRSPRAEPDPLRRLSRVAAGAVGERPRLAARRPRRRALSRRG